MARSPFGLAWSGDREVHQVKDGETAWCGAELEVLFDSYSEAKKEVGAFGDVPVCNQCGREKSATVEG